jgi:hypothetical protein
VQLQCELVVLAVALLAAAVVVALQARAAAPAGDEYTGHRCHSKECRVSVAQASTTVAYLP